MPVHKGGLTDDVNNFRPISLLSIFEKIMENLMHNRLYEVRDTLYGNQFDHRKGKSTIHPLIEITEQIKDSIDNGKYECGVFIDLKKPLILLITTLNTMEYETLQIVGLNIFLITFHWLKQVTSQGTMSQQGLMKSLYCFV